MGPARRLSPIVAVVLGILLVSAGVMLIVRGAHVAPTIIATVAANEAEKAAEINVLEVRSFGSLGRVYLGGEEGDIDVGWRAAVDALEGLEGRDES